MSRRSILLAVVLAMAPCRVLAQPQPSPSEPAAAVAQAAPVAAPEAANDEDWIRPEDVPDRADLLARRLQAGVSSDDARDMLERIEAGLAKIDSELTRAFEQANSALTGHSNLLTIQDARRELEGVSEPFDDWRKQLEAEARRLSAVVSETETSLRRWTRTRDRPETVQAGDSIIRRVHSSIARIEAAKADLVALRVRVLALADRLVDRGNAVAETSAKLEAATIAEGTSVLVPDRPPIWHREVLSQLVREAPLVGARMTQFARATSDYVATDVRPFALQIFLWIGLMLAMRRLPERSRERMSSAQVPAERLRLLARPYAIAGLFVLALSPSMHPTAPHRVMQLLGLIALIPVARILQLANQRSNVSLYLGLLALLLLDRVATALASLPAISQVLFFAQLAIAVTIGVEYRRRLVAAQGSAWVITGLSIAIAGVVAAILAEAGGWASLAMLIGRGILASATAALYVYAITISLEALLSYSLASPTLRSSNFVDRNQPLVQRWGSVGLRIFGAFYWIDLTLGSLGLAEIAGEAVQAVLSAGITVGALSISLGGVLAFVSTSFVAMVMSRLVHEILEDEVFPRTNLPRGIPNALLTLTTYAIWSLGFLLALAAGGVELGQLAILLGGLGVGIGLGLQDVVKNFAAGITLLLERRLHVGDAVQIPDKDVFGRILSIGMRASVVRNWNGAEVVMPNDDLVSGTVTNWTLSDQAHRIEVAVGVAYGTDPARVIDLLLDVARADGRFLENPPPSAFFTAFGESSLDFVLRAWSDQEYESATARKSELAVAVHAALRDAGIDIPFPQREVNLVRVSPEASEALRSQHA